MRRLTVPLLVCLACLAAAPSTLAHPSRHARQPGVDAYRGLGAWVSLYGHEWRDPASAVRALRLHGVETLYLETGRSTSASALDRPPQTSAFVDAAHAAGMAVVAWYYPTFARWSVDAQRMLDTARFRTLGGGGFDAVAADIEDPGVRSTTLRSARLLAFSRRIVRALPGYPWGAITYPPIGLDLNPHAWPAFPWPAVARLYSAILPMAYWQGRTRTPAGAAWYAGGNLAALTFLTGRSDLVVHMIGSGGTSARQAAAFAQASLAGGAAGVSLYPAERLRGGEWWALGAALRQSARRTAGSR